MVDYTHLEGTGISIKNFIQPGFAPTMSRKDTRMTDSTTVQVDRNLIGMDAIRATGLLIALIDEDVVATMPLAPNDTAHILCVKLGNVTAVDFEAEVERRGEVLDPHTFLAFLKTLEKDDMKSYRTQWTFDDVDFGHIFSIFLCNVRAVFVLSGGYGSYDVWEVPVCVRKSSELGA